MNAKIPQNTPIEYWFAIWFGAGLARVAPGTVGTIAAVPVHLALLFVPSLLHLAVVIVLTIAGVYAAERVSQSLADKDPQIVVIDEVAGVLIALYMARGYGLIAMLAAIILFRVFDILKPGPVGRAERLQPAGLGIMADDVVAGVMAGACALLIGIIL